MKKTKYRIAYLMAVTIEAENEEEAVKKFFILKDLDKLPSKFVGIDTLSEEEEERWK